MQEELDIFEVMDKGFRLYDFPDDVQLALTFELSPDLLVIKRQVYGVLDLLGDLGGLASSLNTTFQGLIIVFQYKAAVSYVSNRTFLVKADENKDEDAAVPELEDEENEGAIQHNWFKKKTVQRW